MYIFLALVLLFNNYSFSMQLPDELLTLIFEHGIRQSSNYTELKQFINPVVRTSRDFNRIMKDPKLQQAVHKKSDCFVDELVKKYKYKYRINAALAHDIYPWIKWKTETSSTFLDMRNDLQTDLENLRHNGTNPSQVEDYFDFSLKHGALHVAKLIIAITEDYLHHNTHQLNIKLLDFYYSAIKHKNPAVVQLLSTKCLNFKGEVVFRNCQTGNLLDRAIAEERADIAKALIERGGFLNNKNVAKAHSLLRSYKYEWPKI